MTTSCCIDGNLLVDRDGDGGPGSLELMNSDNTQGITIAAPATATPYTLVIPATNGVAGQYLENDGTGVLSWTSGPPQTNVWQRWIFSDEKTAGTSAQPSTTSWSTRDLNTTNKPTGQGTEAQLSGNSIRLANGTWEVEAWTTAWKSSSVACRIRNVSDSIVQLWGTPTAVPSGGIGSTGVCTLQGIITVVNGPKLYDLEMRADSPDSVGGGIAANLSVPEIYSIVAVTKIA